jgi:DNA-directed RNA polymerase subunit N (RpoN/RPB10)
MIIPIKCFTCGNLLANKYLYYLNQVAELKKTQNKQNENIEYLTEDNMDVSVEGKVLNDLGLKKQCCRRHMLTHVDVF